MQSVNRKTGCLTPNIKRLDTRYLWQFLLDVLLRPNFEKYIRWTGNELEFVFLNGKVVFTEFQKRKRGKLEPNSDDQDPLERWHDTFIKEKDVKNGLRALRMEYYYSGNEEDFKNKPKIEKTKIRGGYAFGNYDSILKHLGTTRPILLQYAEEVAMRCKTPEICRNLETENLEEENQSELKKDSPLDQMVAAATTQNNNKPTLTDIFSAIDEIIQNLEEQTSSPLDNNFVSFPPVIRVPPLNSQHQSSFSYISDFCQLQLCYYQYQCQLYDPVLFQMQDCVFYNVLPMPRTIYNFNNTSYLFPNNLTLNYAEPI